MSDGPPCPFPAEGNRSNFSTYCVEGMCQWHQSDPLCPHPRACDGAGQCIHPKDSHTEWMEMNYAL